jgi:hypothetical protein
MHSQHTDSYRTPGVRLTVFVLIAGSILIAAGLTRGPGMGAYLPWAAALIQNTPAPLDTTTLSPTGFPLLHWYPGTGVFVGLATFFSGGGLNLEYSARLAGSMAILLTLAFSVSLFYEVADKKLGMVVLGVVLLLTATNTGYYIRLLGAELFAMALVASILWLSWIPTRLRNLELAGLAALAGLLMTVRPQSTLMASPALALGLIRWADGRTTRQLAWAIPAVGAPLALGLFVVLQLNYWMTGEWMRPAYIFGNEQFRSVSLTAPYLKMVLFDSDAGILRCTPFIALGFCASLFHIFDRRLQKHYRAFYVVFFLAGLAQIWMVSGFYGWAGGSWRFGSRYLNTLSLYAVIAVVHFWASERGLKVKGAVLGIAAACAAYTASLLGVHYFLPSLAVGAAAGVWMFLRTPAGHDTRDIVYECFGLSILFPLVYYYMRLAQVQLINQHTISAIALACLTGIVIAVALYLIWRYFLIPPRAATGVALLSALTLIIVFGLVVRLSIGAAAFQDRELASPSAQFLYKNSFDIRDLENDLKEEKVYKWPDDVREAAKIFLEDEKRRTEIRR